MVGLLSALPQTRLWHRLKDEKRLTNTSLTGENTDCITNFIPKMGSETLIEGYKKLIAKIYSPKLYYKRIEVMTKTFKPSVKSKLSLDKVRIFFKSVWRIGILSNSRFYYWKLLIKTFFTRKKCFGVAVEASINGHHLQKVAKKLLAS